MDRRAYLGSIGGVVALSTVAGCLGGGDGDDDTDSDDTETQYGTLSTSVTDQPNDIDHFDSLEVTIQGVWIKPADADSENGDTDDQETETNSTDTDSNQSDDGGEDGDEVDEVDESSGRYYIEFEEPQTADLVELQGANSQLIDETKVEVGDYQFLQLDVSDTAGTLADSDDEPDVRTPGNAPLQFQHEFEIRADETTRFIADFAPFQTGQGMYMIRPVASGTRVLYGDEEYDGGDGDGTESDDDGNESDGEHNETDGGNGTNSGD